MMEYWNDVVAVVEQLGLEQVVLIGHSMGGLVIVEATRHLPAAVIGMVGADTWRNIEKIRTPEQIAELVAPFRANFETAAGAFVRARFAPTSDPNLVERVVAAMSAAPPHIAMGAFEALCGYDRQLQAELERIKAPKITINSRSRPTNLAALQRYGIEVMPISDVGHFVMMEDAQSFNHLLDEALQQLIPAGKL